MPVSVDAEFSSALRTVLVEASTASWEFWFGLLEKFQETNGNCRVPSRFTLDDFSLGSWVGVQRQTKDSMSPERKQRLEDVGFVWDPNAEAWEEGFSKLLQFKETEGHCRVPIGFKVDGFNLGMWSSHQRSATDSMSPERKQRLEDVGFVWDPNAEAWEEGFSKLLQFKETEGHYRVPRGFTLDGFNFGSWVSTQRKTKDSMFPERKQRLEDVGFWDPIAEAWEEGFNKLMQFKETNGNCRVPRRFTLDDFSLGSWVGNQRAAKDSMSPERQERLDAIGFVWDTLAEAWEEGFSKLLQFKEAEGHCRVPQVFKVDDFRLGIWTSNQRAAKDSMSPERQERLDAIGFVWDTLAEAWEEGFSKLLQFKEAEGHCRVPQVFKVDDFRLGIWMSTQRAAKDSMSPERQERLDAIGFVWDTLAEAWEEGFSKLLQFKEAEGHCRVPVSFKRDGFSLGTWVSTQRKTKDSMSPERKQRLDEIGFVWASKITTSEGT
jgi:DNA-binding TFAR19-related protein (PDSD5 family)